VLVRKGSAASARMGRQRTGVRAPETDRIGGAKRVCAICVSPYRVALSGTRNVMTNLNENDLAVLELLVMKPRDYFPPLALRVARKLSKHGLAVCQSGCPGRNVDCEIG